MALNLEELKKLNDYANTQGGFNSDQFKNTVNTKYGEGAYDKIRGQLEQQQTNLQNPTQNTQTPAPVQNVPQNIAPQTPQTTPQAITTPVQQNITPEVKKKPVSTTTVQKQATTPSIDWKNISIEDWKKQTGGGLTNLEQLVENKYGTTADVRDNKLYATINGQNYQWTLDNAGNPIKTIATTPTQQLQQGLEQKQVETASKEQVGIELQKMLEMGVSVNDLNSFYAKNKQYAETLNPIMLNHFKTKANLDFFKQYSTYSPEELFNAYKQGNVIVGDEKYNMLPQELRQGFEEYKRAEENKTTGTSFSFEDYNNNVVNMSDILTKVKELFSTNIRSEYESKMNSPEMTKLKEDMTSTSKQIGDLDNTIKNLEDDIRTRYPGASEGYIQSKLRVEQKDLYRKRDDLVTTYNSKSQQYAMNKEEISFGLELSKYEDSINRENFKTAMQMYNTERERMDIKEQREFEVKQAELTAQRQLANQKELIRFEEEINKTKGGEYIDDGKGNLNYVKDGVIISTLSGLGKAVSQTSSDLNDYKIYENDDGSYTSFNVDKKTGKLTQQTFAMDGSIAGGYINTIGTGKITSYGGPHDNYTGLDIDGKKGDPIYSPLAGTVLSVDNYGDKAYGKSVLVKLADGTTARFSHLDTQNVKKGQVFEQGALLGTMGNTGYVQKMNGGDGSHLDLVTYDASGKVRTGKQTEAYIKGLTMKPTDNTSTLKVMQIANAAYGKTASDTEAKRVEQVIKENPNLSTQQLISRIRGLDIKDENKIGEAMKYVYAFDKMGNNKPTGFEAAISSYINKNDTVGLKKYMQSAIDRDVQSLFKDEAILTAGYKSQADATQKIISLIENNKSKIGAFSGTYTDLVKKFKDVGAVQQLQTELTGLLAQTRKNFAGSAVTPSELKALENYVNGSIKENPMNLITKLQTLNEKTTREYLNQRNVYGVPLSKYVVKTQADKNKDNLSFLNK